jgi:hypothetical protein
MTSFWSRVREDRTCEAASGEADVLAEARHRLELAQKHRAVSKELKRRAAQTRELNHWSAMMEQAWADRPVRDE